MTRDEILDFLRANPICFLATVDGDHPRVRGMMLYITADGRIIFHTGKGKNLTAQLSQNCAVEFCAFDPKANMQVRVSGAAEFIDDRALCDENHPRNSTSLKLLIEKYSRGSLMRASAAFRSVTSMPTPLMPTITLSRMMEVDDVSI